MRNIIILSLIFLFHSKLLPKEVDLYEKSSFSIGSSIIFTNNITNFKQLNQFETCCPESFINSNSINYNFEIAYRYFYNRKYAFILNLGIVNYNDSFEEFEQQITRDGIATVRHNMDLHLLNFQTRVGLSNKFNKLNIAYGVIHELIMNTNFNQSENLILPLGATFENNQRRRNVHLNQNADYLNLFNFGIFGQIWYEIYLNNYKSRALVPYFEFNYIFSDYHSFGQFKKINYQFGFQYRFINLKGLDTPLLPSK